MRERGRKNRTSATMLAGWKKAVVLMLALIVCISSIVVPQPEEVSAKQAVYLDYYGKDKPKNPQSLMLPIWKIASWNSFSCLLCRLKIDC